jgi:hypothetical protein
MRHFCYICERLLPVEQNEEELKEDEIFLCEECVEEEGED